MVGIFAVLPDVLYTHPWYTLSSYSYDMLSIAVSRIQQSTCLIMIYLVYTRHQVCSYQVSGMQLQGYPLVSISFAPVGVYDTLVSLFEHHIITLGQKHKPTLLLVVLGVVHATHTIYTAVSNCLWTAHASVLFYTSIYTQQISNNRREIITAQCEDHAKSHVRIHGSTTYLLPRGPLWYAWISSLLSLITTMVHGTPALLSVLKYENHLFRCW